MAQLGDDFEDQLKGALLDEAEAKAREEIAPEFLQYAHDLLEAYGERHDYDVGSLIAAGETRVERRSDEVLVRWGWPEPAIYFERGTVAHEVEAKNAAALSFVWEDPPQWVREEFEQEGDGYRVFLQSVNVAGLPEARFIRDALNWLQRRYA